MDEQLLLAHNINPAEAFAYMSASSVLSVLKHHIHTFIEQEFFEQLDIEIQHIKDRLLGLCHKSIPIDMLTQRSYMQIYPHIVNLDGSDAKHRALTECINDAMNRNIVTEATVLTSLLNILQEPYQAYKLNISDETLSEACYVHDCDENELTKEYYLERINDEYMQPRDRHRKKKWFTYVLYISRDELFETFNLFATTSAVVRRVLMENNETLVVNEDDFFNSFKPKDFITSNRYNAAFMIKQYSYTSLFDAIKSQILSGEDMIYAKIYYDVPENEFTFELPEPKVYPDIVVRDKYTPHPDRDEYYLMRNPHKVNNHHQVFVQKRLCSEFMNCGWVHVEPKRVYDYYRQVIDL